MSLSDREENWIQNGLHNEPHVAIQLWAALTQNDLWDLAQLVLVLVYLKTKFLLHVLDLVHHQFAKVPAKQWHLVDLWVDLL